MNISYTLSEGLSTQLWEEHFFTLGNETFTQYLNIKINGLKYYNWINGYKNLELVFTNESYKTWFLLNLSHEQQTA